MNPIKKYLLIVNAHEWEGVVKNSYKLVLRGRNVESLRNGLSSFIRTEIESKTKGSLNSNIDFLKLEEIETEIKTAIDNWELYPSSEKLYQRDYRYEPEPGDPNPCIEYTQVKNIIKFPLFRTSYEIEVKDVTNDSRLSSCREVIVMSTTTEEIFKLEYPEIIYVKDAGEEKGEEIVYENGHYEIICKTSSELDEHLLCWKRDVLKVKECL